MEKNIKNRLIDFFQKEQNQEEANSFWKFFLHPEDKEEKEEALFGIWNKIENNHPEMEQEAQKAYATFRQKVDKKKRSIQNRYMLSLLKYAAMVATPILLFVSVWEYATNDKQPEIITLSTLNATTQSATLPDGTHVILNAGTTLKYAAEFAGDTREVTLAGEANFAVARNKEKPFIVKTDQLSITALGTKFNVRAYHTDKITTTLEEGSIRVATDKEAMLVNPHEQVIYTSSNQNLEKKRVDIDDATAWMKGELIFEDSSLPDILAEIERHHNIRISVKGILDQKTLYSIKYRNSETLTQMLDVLCYITGNISYRMDNENQNVIVTKLQ